MTLKSKISNKWRIWINGNLEKGVSKDYIFNTLLENGFSYEAAKRQMNYEVEIKHTIPEKWKSWLQENISTGQDKDGLFKILMMNGFSYDSIKEQMQYQPSIPLDELRDPFDQANQNDNKRSALNKSISLLSRNAVKLKTNKLNIFYAKSFLSDVECEYLTKLIQDKLLPSELASPDKDKFFRTSKTCDLTEFDDKTVKTINERICSFVGIEDKFSEPIQGQFYEIGQEFKPHTDFFEKTELVENAGILGQRSLTVMIYLNAVELGGETSFPRINEEFIPEKGKAVIWSNLNSDCSPNHHSLHHAKKVRAGYKAIITKWFRSPSYFKKLRDIF